jgi:hypothetical protein
MRLLRIQYPGAAYHVMGVALATSSVTVNSQTPYRKGEHFRKEVSVANTGGPVWQSITVAATGQSPVTGNEFVPKTPEVFGYDLDGNLTSDGQWSYVWDAINHAGGLYGPDDPDNLQMDANGPDGRATMDTLQSGHLFGNGDRAHRTTLHGGHARINLTERKTKDLLSDFEAYVKANGKPCGACWRQYVGGKN